MGLFHPRATSAMLCLQTGFTPAHTSGPRRVPGLRGRGEAAQGALVSGTTGASTVLQDGVSLRASRRGRVGAERWQEGIKES